MSGIPVTVISGCLGVGKTTWINRLLSRNYPQRIAVLVNDFGDITVDEALIATHSGKTITLKNGCVCCSIGDDLTRALMDVTALSSKPGEVERASMIPDENAEDDRQLPEHIIVEASGVADPCRIAHQARGLRQVHVNGVLTLVNPLNVQRLANDKFVGSTVRRQLYNADLIAFTHTDTCLEKDLQDTRMWIDNVAPGSVVSDSFPDASFAGWWQASVLDGVSPAPHATQELNDPSSMEATSYIHKGIHSFVWYPQGPVAQAKLRTLLCEWQSQILRCKGWIRFKDKVAQQHLVQMTSDEYTTTPITAKSQTNVLQFIVTSTPEQDARLRCDLDFLVDTITV